MTNYFKKIDHFLFIAGAFKAIEICNFLHGLSPIIIKNVLHLYTNITYNLRSRSKLCCTNPKTVKYGTETISHLATKVLSLVPEAKKSSKSVDGFKSKIRQWEPD